MLIRFPVSTLCLTTPNNFIPNAFTPNNDGVNDVFEFYSAFAKNLAVKIYNRWGELVFESIDIEFFWDGTIHNSGEICPIGNYIVDYVIEGYDGSILRDKKSVILLR